MFGFLAFLPRTICILLQLLCPGFCLGITTNSTSAGNLLLLTFHHIITPTVIIITTTAHIIASAFAPTFATATEIWETTIPQDQDWSTAATVETAIATMISIWQAFQNHQNKVAPFNGRRDNSLLDLIKTKHQPIIDNLDETADDRNPTDIPVNTNRHDATNARVITWVSEHLTALRSIATLTRNIQLADEAWETAQELAKRIPLEIEKKDWEEIEEAVGTRNTARNMFVAARDRPRPYQKLYKEKARDIGKYTNEALINYFLTQESSILELEKILDYGPQNSTEIRDALDIHDREVTNAAPAKRPDWVPPYLNQAWPATHPMDPDLAVAPALPPPTIIRERPDWLPAIIKDD